MSIILESINRINALSSKSINKLVTETFNLNEERMNYVLGNINIILNSSTYIGEKILIAALDDKHIEILFKKYFDCGPINMCHIRSEDTKNTIMNIIYTDGLEDLYNVLQNSISIVSDEFVLAISIALQSGYFTDRVKEVKRKFNESNTSPSRNTYG